MAAQRNHTVDILRLAAAFAVICLHNFSGSGVWAGEQIVALCRFAVPLFFLFSGYFSAGFDRKRKLRQILRIFLLTILSNLAYFALDLSRVQGGSFMVELHLRELLAPQIWRDFLLFNESPFSSHLWFLGALLYCLLLDFLFDCLFGRFIENSLQCTLSVYRKIAAVAAAAVLGTGLIIYDRETIYNAINGIDFGIEFGENLRVSTLLFFRNFFFFGLPFFTFGKLIRNSDFPAKPRSVPGYVIGIIALNAFILIENWFWGVFEVYCGSIILTFLLMHLALSHPLSNGGKFVRLLGWLGQNTTLTIYIVHIYFLDLFRNWYWANLPWQYEPGVFHLIPIGVFMASLAVGVAVGLVKTGLAARRRKRKAG